MRKTVYFMLLCFSVLFISCSEDDRYQLSEPEKLENGFKRSTINFGEMKERLSDRMYSLESLKIISQKDGDSTYIQSIDSTHIIVFSNDTLTTYTMKVSTLDDENYSLSNLVIKTEGDVTEEYVIHYNPTPEWQAAHESGEYLPYEGELSMVSIEGDTVTEQRSSLMICSFSVEPIYDCNTCMGRQIIGYDITIHCYTVPGSGGGGGGPGPGPGGPGPGPGEGGGSGNGGDDPGLPTDPNYGGDITPCQALQTKINNEVFRIKINDLKANLSTTSEKGWTDYELNENANSYEAMVPFTRDDGTYGVRPLNQTSDVTGYMHSHTIRPDKDMPVPSAADFRGFIEVVNRRDDFHKSTAETYVIMVGIHGDGHQTPRKIRTYALKVENISKLRNWLLDYDTDDKRKKYFDKMKKVEKKIHNHPNTEAENEKAILNLMKMYNNDLGLVLYKANEANTGWSKMILDSYGKVDFIPCI